MKKRIFFCILCFCLATIVTNAQSKIQKAKDNLSTSAPQRGVIDDSPYYRSSSDDLGNGFLADFLYFIFFEISVGLSYHILFQGANEINSPMYHASLPPYPFYKNSKGDYQYYNNEAVRWRLDASNYHLTERGKLSVNLLDLKARLGHRFSVSPSYLRFRETLIREKEKLDLLSVTVDYYRVRTPYLTMYWGLGAGYIANELSTFGLSVKTGMEIFIKPFTIQTDFNYISFKNSDITSFSIGPKFHFRQYHLGAKYQYFNLAGSRISGVSFGVGLSL